MGRDPYDGYRFGGGEPRSSLTLSTFPSTGETRAENRGYHRSNDGICNDLWRWSLIDMAVLHAFKITCFSVFRE